MAKIDLMKKFYFLVFTFLLALGYGQSVQLYNPATSEIYQNEQYFCAGEKFNFKVDAVASSTGDYVMSSALPTDFGLSTGSLPINFPSSGADKFSEAFPIGFNFSFYGKTYSKVVMGSNGRLVFTNDPELENLKNTAVYTDRTFSGVTGYNTFAALPSADYNKIFKANRAQELNLAQIFFGYTDLVPKSANGSVVYLYKNVVVGGVNGLMVSFQNQIRTNGTGDISSTGYYSYILLLEDGRIVIYVNNKSEIRYNAILGIQNDDAIKFKVPTHSISGENYNNGPWKSEGKAWLFTPNQNLTPVFKWFQNATLLGETTNTLLNFSPNDGDILKVEVTYHDPSGAQVGAMVSDQVIFKKIAKPMISYNAAAACVSGVSMTVPNDPDLNFEWYLVGNATALGTGNSYYATQNGSYFVRATRKTLPICSVDSDSVPVNLNSTIPPFNPNNVSLKYCDNTGATSKIINLYDYYPPGSNYTLQFIDGVTPVADPTNFIIYANTTRTVGIYANDPVSDCTVLRNFDLRFDSLPVAANNLTKRFCFGETSVDISQYLQDLAGSNFSVFDYQYSSDGINYAVNSIINPRQFPKVWVKIVPKNVSTGSCNTISTLIFTEDAKVIANAPTTQLAPQCSSSFSPFNLNSLKPEINSGNVTVTYHNTLNGAIYDNDLFLNDNAVGSKTVYVRVVDNVTGCVSPDHPSASLLVYAKPTLLLTSIPKSNCQGNTIFNLKQNVSDLVTVAAPITVTLEYHAPNGDLLVGSQITAYDESVYGPNPYIKVIYNTTCSDSVSFSLSYNLKPVAITSSILLCAETTYSLQDFKNKAISNPVNYTFTDLSGSPLPASFNLSVLPKSVDFFIKDNTTGCVSNPQTITFVKGGSSVLMQSEADYILCDIDFDGKTAFNLDSKKAEFTNSSATFEYFKDSGFTQNISSDYTNETPFAQTVYVRITVAGFCPSTAKINLKVNTPTKSMSLLNKYMICFGETILVDAGSENVMYKWSTGETTRTVNFSKTGNYSVVLTNANGCSYTHNFTISDENQPKIQVVNQTNNSIEVIAEGGAKPYQYYFNGVAQSSNILQNPAASSYVIQVKSAAGCLGPPKTVYFIKINNTFTPNADGINDVWKIENLAKMQEVSILIVDRNGTKVFESTNPTKTEWDGKANGRTLPTSTYWYVISWYDAVTQKAEQRQGWILMKNRN
ncbi:gliding motility-associated-like protein [Chryseobacterium sp. MDT2-18]|nr:gliding motility-associated-like protein [Chryseobacterium sp. MDT2-18]